MAAATTAMAATAALGEGGDQENRGKQN